MQLFAYLFLFLLCAMSVFSTRWMLAFSMVFFALEVALEGSVELFRSNLTLANYIVGIITLIALTKSLTIKENPLKAYFNPVFYMILAIFIWSIVSLIWSPALPIQDNTGSNIIKGTWPQFILTVLLTPLLVWDLDDWNAALPKFLLLGSITCLMIFLNPEFTIKNGRIGIDLGGGLRTSPLAIGQVGGIIAVISALYIPPKRSFWILILQISSFVLGSLLAFRSGSRGQILFSGIIIIAFYPMARKIKNFKSFFGAVFGFIIISILALLAFQYVSGESEVNRWSDQGIESGTGIRFFFIIKLLSAFAYSPVAWIIGLGFNAFSSLGEGLYGQGYSHSAFVDVLAELGIPAFVILLTALAISVQSGVVLFRRFSESQTHRAAVASLIAMLAYQILLSNKEGNLWSSVNLFLFMLLLVRIEILTRDHEIETLDQIDEEDLRESKY